MKCSIPISLLLKYNYLLHLINQYLLLEKLNIWLSQKFQFNMQLSNMLNLLKGVHLYENLDFNQAIQSTKYIIITITIYFYILAFYYKEENLIWQTPWLSQICFPYLSSHHKWIFCHRLIFFKISIRFSW